MEEWIKTFGGSGDFDCTDAASWIDGRPCKTIKIIISLFFGTLGELKCLYLIEIVII